MQLFGLMLSKGSDASNTGEAAVPASIGGGTDGAVKLADMLLRQSASIFDVLNYTLAHEHPR